MSYARSSIYSDDADILRVVTKVKKAKPAPAPVTIYRPETVNVIGMPGVTVERLAAKRTIKAPKAKRIKDREYARYLHAIAS